MPRRRFRRTHVRAIATAAVVIMVAGTAAADAPDTREQISEARARLRALEERITALQDVALSMNDALKALAGEVGRSRRGYEAIHRRLTSTQALRGRTADRYQLIRGEIDRAAAEAYIRGPSYAVETLIDQKSLSDAADVVAYTRSITARTAELGEEVRRVANELANRARQESALKAQRAAALSTLTAKRDALTERFTEQQARLAELSRDRTELGALLVRLREQLRAEELAAARAALARGTPLTFGDWANAFLRHIGAPRARNNLVAMVAWQVAEYTAARWNPLATTYPMPGSTEYNSHGVRNYVSLTQGLQATRLTLSHCCYGYERILANLARNAASMETAEAINASRWCYGCAGGGYVVDLIPSVEQYYDRYANQSA